MKYTYQQWLFADKAGRELIMRDVFERLEELERRQERLEVKHNPLAGLSRSVDIIAKVKQAEASGM